MMETDFHPSTEVVTPMSVVSSPTDHSVAQIRQNPASPKISFAFGKKEKEEK